VELGAVADGHLVDGVIDLLGVRGRQRIVGFARGRVQLDETFKDVQVRGHRGGARGAQRVKAGGKGIGDAGLDSEVLVDSGRIGGAPGGGSGRAAAGSQGTCEGRGDTHGAGQLEEVPAAGVVDQRQVLDGVVHWGLAIPECLSDVGRPSS
jgi:hypothetical protein